MVRGEYRGASRGKKHDRSPMQYRQCSTLGRAMIIMMEEMKKERVICILLVVIVASCSSLRTSTRNHSKTRLSRQQL